MKHPVASNARKTTLGALASLIARAELRKCTHVGAGARIDGRPYIVNAGSLSIGDDFELRSRPVQSHLVVGTGAALVIGDRVRIGAGAALACMGRIEIESDARLGAFCTLMDSDFHVAGQSDKAPEPKPIRVGRGATLGHRVVVLPGSRIGRGASVLAGSVVSGDVPDGVTIEGNPARVRLAGGSEEGELEVTVPALVQTVLGLSQSPTQEQGPEQIAEWDSLGALRLVLALEERYSITLTEDEIRGARSIRDVTSVVRSAQARKDEARG
jgi:acetyltransferase-like isoleucine patch superfamily enzyme/acyl carrier protein